MRLFESFRAQQSGVEKSVFNGFLHFKPLRGSPVEMTKAQILIIICIIPNSWALIFSQGKKEWPKPEGSGHL